VRGTVELSRRFGGKKFMWDGNTHSTEEQAWQKAREYQERGFQVELVAEHDSDDRFYLFTRREVKESVVERRP